MPPVEIQEGRPHCYYKIGHTVAGREYVELLASPGERVLKHWDFLPDHHDPAWCGIPGCFNCQFAVAYDRRRLKERESA